MINIVPAILTEKNTELNRLLRGYDSCDQANVDIDIQEVPFSSEPTVNFADTFKIVAEIDLSERSLGWDLKLAQPEEAVEKIFKKYPKHRVYVYSSAEIGFITKLDLTQYHLGLGVLARDELPSAFFLQQFPEVQLMTVKEEKQGDGLDAELLERSRTLRAMGYQGMISIDGGVNLETAELVRQYPIDRVSVGSYLQQSKDVQAAYKKLDQALNG